jgi:anion-transporting  ArsA/GET3 family ATPase
LGAILPNVPKACKFNVSAIKDEIKNVKDGLVNVGEQIKIAKTADVEGDKFVEKMETFFTSSKERMDLLEKNLETVFDELKNLAKLYSIPENDMLQKPDEFFVDLQEFIVKFKQAHDKNLQIIEKAEKEEKKKKELEKKELEKQKKLEEKNKKNNGKEEEGRGVLDKRKDQMKNGDLFKKRTGKPKSNLDDDDLDGESTLNSNKINSMF